MTVTEIADTNYPGTHDANPWTPPTPRSPCCPKMTTSLEGVRVILDHESVQYVNGDDSVWGGFTDIYTVFAGTDPSTVFVDPDDLGLFYEVHIGGTPEYDFGDDVYQWLVNPAVGIAVGWPQFADVLWEGVTGTAVKFTRVATDYDPNLEDSYADYRAEKSAIRCIVLLSPAWSAADAASGGIQITTTKVARTFAKETDSGVTKYSGTAGSETETTTTETINPAVGATEARGSWHLVTPAEGEAITVSFEAAPDWTCLGG